MPGRPRTRARKAVEAVEGTLVGPGVSPRSTALALVARIEDPVAARQSVLDRCLDLMERAAAADAYIAAAAFANILLRELPAAPTADGVKFGSAREALAWWRAHEQDLEAMAKAEEGNG